MDTTARVHAEDLDQRLTGDRPAESQLALAAFVALLVVAVAVATLAFITGPAAVDITAGRKWATAGPAAVDITAGRKWATAGPAAVDITAGRKWA